MLFRSAFRLSDPIHCGSSCLVMLWESPLPSQDCKLHLFPMGSEPNVPSSMFIEELASSLSTFHSFDPEMTSHSLQRASIQEHKAMQWILEGLGGIVGAEAEPTPWGILHRALLTPSPSSQLLSKEQGPGSCAWAPASYQHPFILPPLQLAPSLSPPLRSLLSVASVLMFLPIPHQVTFH